MSLNVPQIKYEFKGCETPPDYASPAGYPFVSKITKTAGAPYCKAVAGAMELALTADNEVQNVCFYMKDVLAFPIAKLKFVEIWAACTAALDASVTASFGVAAARNDAPRSMAEYALFQCVANNNLVVSAYDGVNTNNGLATGLTLPTTFQKHVIDFCTGVKTVAGGLSLGGAASTKFSIENSSGILRRVETAAPVDMSQYTGNFQFFAQLQKTAAAITAKLQIQKIIFHLREE